MQFHDLFVCSQAATFSGRKVSKREAHTKVWDCNVNRVVVVAVAIVKKHFEKVPLQNL